MENSNSFVWNRCQQFGVLQIFLAFAIPSLIAFCGFRIVLPSLVANGLPSIVAWPIIASLMLLSFVVVAIWLLKREAIVLNVSLSARMCFKRLTGKQWLFYTGIIIAGLVIAAGTTQLVTPFMTVTGLSVPQYMPFFLNPTVDPVHSDPDLISPGFPLKGQIFLIPLYGITLILNILAEEFYFRAWLMPKMAKYGQFAWVLNAILFASYHTFQLWLFPSILVGSLIWAYVIFRSKSIFPALIGHFVGNFLGGILGIAMLVLE